MTVLMEVTLTFQCPATNDLLQLKSDPLKARVFNVGEFQQGHLRSHLYRFYRHRYGIAFFIHKMSNGIENIDFYYREPKAVRSKDTNEWLHRSKSKSILQKSICLQFVSKFHQFLSIKIEKRSRKKKQSLSKICS